RFGLLDLLVDHPGFGRQGAPRHARDHVGRHLVERDQRRPQHDLHVRLSLGDLRDRVLDRGGTLRRARLRPAQGLRPRGGAQAALGHETVTALAPSGASAEPALDPHPYRSILSLSLPAAITYSLMATESAILNLLLKRLDHPTESIAAYAIQYRVLQF